jgi:hypothetical protein
MGERWMRKIVLLRVPEARAPSKKSLKWCAATRFTMLQNRL